MEPKNSAKVFSFVDSPDSSRVKSHRSHHNGGVAPEGAIRAATDRAVKDRKHPLYRCSGRTYLGNRLSHQAGLSIRKIAGATGLSSSQIHQFSTRPKPRRFQSGRANRAEVPVERKKPNCLSRKPRSDPAWRGKLSYCDAALIGCSDWSVAKMWL